MGQSNKKLIESFLEVFHHESAPDAAILAEYMSEDIVYWSLVPSAPQLRGVDAIAKGIEKQFGTYRDCRCEIHAIAEGGGVVFTERTDHVVLNSDDRAVAARINAIFEIGNDGKIIAWREYWDSNDVITQMGIDQEVLKEDLG